MVPSGERGWEGLMDEKRIEIVRFDGLEIEVAIDSKTVKLRERRREDLKWTKPPCKKTSPPR